MLVLRNQAAVEKAIRPLAEIRNVFTQVRLIGMNSTAETRSSHNHPTPALVQQLELVVACYVVFEFSKGGAAVLEQLNSLAQPLPLEKSVDAAERAARCVDFREDAEVAVKQGTTQPQPELVQPGSWWLAGNEHLVRMFVGLCSRIFHKLHSDVQLVKRIPLRLNGPESDELHSPYNRRRLHEWLVDRASMQQPNDFMLKYRDFIFESALPMHSRYAQSSRRSARLNKITSVNSLLDHECGFQIMSRLHALMGGSIVDVARDTKHELHSMLLLMMFHYQMQQATAEPFINTHYIGGQWVLVRPVLQGMLQTWIQWGMNKRPLIVELQRRLYVVDVSGTDDFERGSPEEQAKRVECVECGDIYHALLYWVHLMHTKYNDELLTGTPLRRFYEPFTPVLGGRTS
jgi:hypothetical protein